MTHEEMQAKIAELEAKLAAKNAPAKITLRVSEKRAVSVYGLGRFPVTLYAPQWERLLGEAQRIRDFIAANAGQLSTSKDA
jgi:hypothetical protein